MIRLWFEVRDSQGNQDWQIELESIQTGQTHKFSAPQAMFGFLMGQLAFDSSTGPDGMETEDKGK
ncbi:MAG TPA: hypothetical protein VMN57_12330 [Anaerolineales bacterium]|nr:hypothetical protein [Anaerolineales bacterium]